MQVIRSGRFFPGPGGQELSQEVFSLTSEVQPSLTWLCRHFAQRPRGISFIYLFIHSFILNGIIYISHPGAHLVFWALQKTPGCVPWRHLQVTAHGAPRAWAPSGEALAFAVTGEELRAAPMGTSLAAPGGWDCQVTATGEACNQILGNGRQ